MNFYVGNRRPLNEADVVSLNHPNAISQPVYAYLINGEIVLGTTCPRLGTSRVVLRPLRNFILPDDAVLIDTIVPTNQLCVDEC